MFKVYDRYLTRQLLIATLVIAGGLSTIILLTQSLKLIELVLESNASSRAFLTLMGLSMPRFIEAVLPASVLIATLFVFHRLSIDSEMIVLRASGASPMRLARPVLISSGLMLGLLLVLSLWISPVGIAHMQSLRKEIRAQYAHLLFREGIFNTVGANLTAYVRARAPDGRLQGLMVHDTRGVAKGGPEITVIAKSGHVVSEDKGQKIIVYDGSRQEKNLETGKFTRLDFQQYTLDIPEASDQVAVRWREPDERTIGELIDNKLLAEEDAAARLQFRAEFHRRLTTPFLMISFAMIGVASLLLGPFSRAGQMPLLGIAAFCSMVLQGLYLYMFNVAKTSFFGCVGMYVLAIIPLFIALFFLTPSGERLLARIGVRLHHYIHIGGRS